MQDASSDKGRRLKQPPDPGGKQPPAKAGATLLPVSSSRNWTGGAPKRSPHPRPWCRASGGRSGRLAPNRSRRLHDAGIAPRKLHRMRSPSRLPRCHPSSSCSGQLGQRINQRVHRSIHFYDIVLPNVPPSLRKGSGGLADPTPPVAYQWVPGWQHRRKQDPVPHSHVAMTYSTRSATLRW